MPRDRQDPRSVRHHNAYALADDSESSLFQRGYRLQMVHSRDLWHMPFQSVFNEGGEACRFSCVVPVLVRAYLNDAAILIARQLLGRFDVLLNGDTDVIQCFLFCSSPRPAARKARTKDALAFLRSAKDDAIIRHVPFRTPASSSCARSVAVTRGRPTGRTSPRSTNGLRGLSGRTHGCRKGCPAAA